MKISFRVGRVHISNDQDAIACCALEIGTFADHQAAYDAILADHVKILPDKPLVWTRPNWTAVCEHQHSLMTPDATITCDAITWTILQMDGDVARPEMRGPARYEMDTH